MTDSVEPSSSSTPFSDTSSSSPSPVMRWTPLDRAYTVEYTALASAANMKLTKQHPLLGRANKVAFNFSSIPQQQQQQQGQDEQKMKQEEEKTTNDVPLPVAAVPLDPLSALLSPSSVAASPLASSAFSSPSAAQTTVSTSSPTPTRPITYTVNDRFEAWSAKRSKILSKYTTTKKIAFSAFSAADEKDSSAIKEVSTAKSRLEELEEQAGVGAGGGAGGAEKQQLTAKEYVAQIGELKEKLRQAWEAGERVISLKIAIQCAKMLGDVSTASFYPSTYVLLTDILDSFGDLVFDRIKNKGVESYQSGVKVSSSLPPSFSSTDVCASAKETCQNWFYKTACIPSVDHRVLTSVGFLFLEEIEAHIAAGEEMLYASYDPASETLTYATGQPIIVDAPVRYVEFVQAATRARWDGTSAAQPYGQRKESHVSLRVTADHDMFVQLGSSTKSGADLLQFKARTLGGADIPYAKEKALSLVPGRAELNAMRLLCAPPAGLQTAGLAVGNVDGPVAALQLRTDAEIDAFLELYGYWLGDGTISYRRVTGGTDAVKFCTIKDAEWLLERFRRLGLVKGPDYRHWTGRQKPRQRPVHEIELRTPRWFEYFDDEYWLKYEHGRARRADAATPPATPARPAATTTATATAVAAGPSSSSSSSSSFSSSSFSSSSSSTEMVDEEGEDDEEGSGNEVAAARGGLEDEPDVGGYTALTDPSAAATRRREELRLLGIVPPNVKSAKWFWYWVWRRLNARQMRLLIEGLRIADGRSGEGGTVIYTSSVNFRDALLQMYLHAGYSGHIGVNTPAGPRQAWLRVPTDGHVYNREQKEAVLEDEPSTSFRQIVTRVTSWCVYFSTVVSRVLQVADVRFDGGAPSTTSTHSRGYVAVKGDEILRLGGPDMAVRLRVSEGHLTKLVNANHPTHTTPQGWRVWKADVYDEKQASTAQATTASPLYDAVSDGRTWCVQLDVVHARDRGLIVVQRAIRDASGQVVQASRPTIVGNCIRELLPRLYVDMTLLKCYRFIFPVDTLQQHIARIGRMMRGIGDTLIACYARCYLAAKVSDVYMSYHVEVAKAGEGRHIPEEYRPVLIEALTDHLQLLRGVSGGGVKEEYLSLMQPALEYFTQCALYGANKDTFTQLFTLWKEHNNSSLILYHFLASFDSTLIARHALNLLTLINDASPTTNAIVPPHLLYLILGQQLLITVPANKHRLSILNEVWKNVTKVDDVKEYLAVAEVWIQYLVKFFTEREINIFLKDIIKHCRHNEQYKTVVGVQEAVARVINSIITLSTDVKRTLMMDSFLLLLDLLDKKSKMLIAKTILSQFSTHGFSTSDPVILHTLFDMSRTLHDSVDSLTFEDERRQIAHLLIAFIRCIDYGRDLEQQLSIYVECRQAFTSLDTVTGELIQRVALLANRAHFLMKGRHSKKTSAFVKACLAYVHITIPSLDDRFARLRLFLVGAQVALVNHMITQSEALLKAAISLLADMPAYQTINGVQVNSEEMLLSYVRNFTSFLLLFPGHPEHGPFYLVKGLLNAIQACQVWKAESGGSAVGKVRVYLGMLALFFTYYQKDFPYHISDVESNDTLYGLSAVYLTELASFVDTLMTEIMSSLVAYSERDDLLSRKQSATLCLDFINLLLAGLRMDERVGGLVVKLMGMVKRAGAKVLDVAYVSETRKHLQSKKGLIYEEVYNKLVAQELIDGGAGTAGGAGGAGGTGVKSQPTANGRPASALTNDPFQIRVTAGPSTSSPVNRLKVAGPL